MPPANKNMATCGTFQEEMLQTRSEKNHLPLPASLDQGGKPMKLSAPSTGKISTQHKLPKCERISDVEVRYFIEYHNELGRGTHTIVRTCVDRETGKRLAIKSAPKKKQLRKQIRIEAEILSDLEHPNILQFKNYLEDDKALYVVTELCQGGDLLEAVIKNSKRRPFPEEDAARIIEQILQAVEYLHSKNVCHRDLKLENILLTHKRHLDIKIVDFDLATKHFDESKVPLSKRAGTCNYMAPEVIQGSYSKLCDVWSLGVTAYALLSGTVPFSGVDQNETFEMICHCELKFPSCDNWDDISEVAKDFLRHCLEKNPLQRWSAKELLQHEWITKSRDAKPLTRFQKLKKLLGNPPKCTTASSVTPIVYADETCRKSHLTTASRYQYQHNKIAC